MSKKIKEHELRLKELENEHEAREHALKMKEKEIEQTLKDREYEKEQEDKRREQEDKQREHELKLKEMELELKKLEMSQNVKSESSNTGHDRSPRAPAFRFNIFNERTDDLDSWFNTFESQCDIFQVPDIDRKAHLIGLFSGKYREALLSFSDYAYSEIRDKMLLTFNLTTDGYRRRFFSLAPDEDETIHAYRNRLQSCFDKWINLAKIDEDYKSLRDLIIYHQMLESCNSEFIKFILIQGGDSTEKVVTLASSFFQANPNQQLAGVHEKFLASNAAAYNQHPDNRGRGDSEVISNPEVPRAVVAVALAADQVGDLTSQFSPPLVGIVMR